MISVIRSAVVIVFIFLLIIPTICAQNLVWKNFIVNGRAVAIPVKTEMDEIALRSDGQSEFRTINGIRNNNANPQWGSTESELLRLTGESRTNTSSNIKGITLPNARLISNQIMNQEESILDTRNLSALVFTWAQFLDHDISLSPEVDEDESALFEIELPSNEKVFTKPIEFNRSFTNENGEQENVLTAWIDGSNVYGSHEFVADWLRTFKDGKLKQSAGELLPYNTTDGQYESPLINDPKAAPIMAGSEMNTKKMFVAGDIRANEQPGLTALHTLFVREHNRLCDFYINQGLVDDEEIYQKARRMVYCTLQKITFEEFLPALGVQLDKYTTYNENVQPDIMNEFSTAAYRLGHTMINSDVPIGGADKVDLFRAFFNPSIITKNGIDGLLSGLSKNVQQKTDALLVSDIRNFLFPQFNDEQPFGLDLATLNILRGRDHGLVSYKTIWKHYNKGKLFCFKRITKDRTFKRAIKRTYRRGDKIDLWVGLLAEQYDEKRTSIGPTLHAMLKQQFTNLRDGDFYYYKREMQKLSMDEKKMLFDNSFKNVINRNSNANINSANAFIVSLFNQ